MFKFGIDFLRNPSRALDFIEKEPQGALRASAGVYGLYLASAVLFYTLKPDNFPPITGVEPALTEHGLLFWVKVQAWSPVLLAVWIIAAAWFGKLLGAGKLAIRLPAALAAAVIPLLLITIYNNSQLSAGMFGVCWIGLVAVMIPGFRRVTRDEWLRLSASLAGLHIAAIALLIPFTIAVMAQSPRAYHAVEFAMLFWILGLATYSVRRVLGVPTARAFCAVFLSLIAQILFVFSMHLIGVLPKEVLKALMAA